MTLTDLLAYIDANINTKTGTERITGALHNAVLKQTINSLIEIISTGFGGKIATSDNPGTFTNPIYFIATEEGTYNYCGGVSVSKLPAFIVFDGNEWSVMEFDLSVEIEGPEIKAKGVIFDNAIPPSSPNQGDYYIFLGNGTLNWSGATIDRPGIIYCTTTTPVSWGFEPFEKDISIDDIEGLASALESAIQASTIAAEEINGHINSPNAHNANSISVDSSNFTKNLSSDDNTVQKIAEKIDQLNLDSDGEDADTFQQIIVFNDLETFEFTQDSDFKITEVVTEPGITATLKTGDKTTDYVLGDTITAFGRIFITVDNIGAIKIKWELG